MRATKQRYRKRHKISPPFPGPIFKARLLNGKMSAQPRERRRRKDLVHGCPITSRSVLESYTLSLRSNRDFIIGPVGGYLVSFTVSTHTRQSPAPGARRDVKRCRRSARSFSPRCPRRACCSPRSPRPPSGPPLASSTRRGRCPESERGAGKSAVCGRGRQRKIRALSTHHFVAGTRRQA